MGFALYKPRGVLSDPMPGSGQPSIYDLAPPRSNLFTRSGAWTREAKDWSSWSTMGAWRTD